MTARETLEAYADILYGQAAEAHAQGMALTERSARLRQLASIVTDEEAERLVKLLETEGLADSSNANSKGGQA